MTQITKITEALKQRYSNLHPLIYKRSFEYAKDEVELFDILDSIPDEYPINWNEELRCWQNLSH
jgi:hypothetical protein